MLLAMLLFNIVIDIYCCRLLIMLREIRSGSVDRVHIGDEVAKLSDVALFANTYYER